MHTPQPGEVMPYTARSRAWGAAAGPGSWEVLPLLPLPGWLRVSRRGPRPHVWQSGQGGGFWRGSLTTAFWMRCVIELLRTNHPPFECFACSSVEAPAVSASTPSVLPSLLAASCALMLSSGSLPAGSPLCPPGEGILLPSALNLTEGREDPD